MNSTASSLVMKRARQNDDVGVVVFFDKFGDLLAPHQTGADALMLVERDGHSFARTAEGDAALEFALFDRFGQRMREIRVVHRFGRVGAEVVDIVPLGSQITDQELLHFIARMVAGDSYFFLHTARLIS